MGLPVLQSWVRGTESRKWTNEFNGKWSYSCFCSSVPCVLFVGTVPAYTGFWFNAYTESWRMTPILSAASDVAHCVFRIPFQCSFRLAAARWWIICRNRVNPMRTSSFTELLCCKVGPLVWGNIIWNPMPVDGTLYKPSDGGAGWDSMVRKGKADPGPAYVSILLWTKNRHLNFPGWKEPTVVKLLPSGWFVSWGRPINMVLYWGLSVGRCYRQDSFSGSGSQIIFGKWESVPLAHE